MLSCLLLMSSLAAAPVPAEIEAKPAPPPAFAEICFDDFEDRGGYPGQEELKRLLGQVPGHEYRIQRQPSGNRQLCQITGFFQLKEPWQPGTALRFSISTNRALRLYFWRGGEGVAMCFFPSWYQQWGGYRTTRSGNKPQPETYAFCATDEGRYQQSGAGTVMVLCQADRLALLRGDLLLMSIPLAGPPTEVFLDVEGQVRGLQFLQCTGGPVEPAPLPAEATIDKPAAADWRVRLPQGVAFNKLPDGSVELAADDKTQAAEVSLEVCRPGLHQFLFEIEDAAVGTGAFLADREGNQNLRLALLHQSTTRRPVLGLIEAGNATTEQWHDFNGYVVPYAGRRQYVALIPGAGVWKFAVSGDGVHWYQSLHLLSAQRPPSVRVGLYCLAGDKKRSIKLRWVQVRRLEALSSLAPRELVERVARQLAEAKAVPGVAAGSPTATPPSLARLESLDQWSKAVEALRPADVAATDWQRACIVYTLGECPNTPRYQALLFRLLGEMADGPWPVEVKLQALHEAALLINSLDAAATNQLADCYGQLGQWLLRQGHPQPFSTLSGGLLRAPIPTRIWPRVAWDDLFLAEAVPLIYQQRWRPLEELCRRIRFCQQPRRTMWNLPPDEAPLAELSDWARTAIPRRAVKPLGETLRPSLRWRSLLLPPISKEGFNTLADIEAALQGQAYREACQAIIQVEDFSGFGLVPDSEDRRLLVAFPAAVRLMMDRYPALRKAMDESFARIGRLRLQEALDSGDEQAVETLAAQFCGTTVAVAAHQWLGERAVSAGRFDQSIGQFRQALYGAPPEQRAALGARARLAAALAGRRLAGPVQQPVQIGEAHFTPEQFEQLIAELLQARGGAPGASLPAAAPAVCPPPGRYQARPFGRLAGDDVAPPPNLPGADLDWGARQAALLLTGQQMILSNRAWVLACSLADGNVAMQRRMQPDKGQQGWPLVPLRPAISGSRLFVRGLTREGPLLACLDLGNGNELWRCNPDRCVASDPLLGGQDLYVLTLQSMYPQKLLLSLCRVEPGTGKVLGRTSLAEFLDLWQGVLPCQATLSDERIVATVGGCVICCDTSGRCLWLRQQVWIPPRDESAPLRPWYAQVHDRPLVADDRVFATQPGMRSVECLHLDSGRLLWQQTIPRLVRVLGLVGQRLVVATPGEVLGLDTASGKVVWEHRLADRLEAFLCGEPSGVLLVQLERTTDPNAPRRPLLVWLDALSGRPFQESVVETAPQPKPMFGPLLAGENRLWLVFGQPQNPATREIWELTRVP